MYFLFSYFALDMVLRERESVCGTQARKIMVVSLFSSWACVGPVQQYWGSAREDKG